MTNSSFVTEALQQVGSPEILVNMVSRRVRLLGQGARPLVEVHPRWTLMEIALKEIADRKLTFEAATPPANAEESEAEEAAAKAALFRSI